MAEARLDPENFPFIGEAQEKLKNASMSSFRDLMVEALTMLAAPGAAIPQAISKLRGLTVLDELGPRVARALAKQQPEFAGLENQMASNLRKTIMQEAKTLPDEAYDRLDDLRLTSNMGLGEKAGTMTKGKFSARGTFPKVRGTVDIADDLSYDPGTIIHEIGAHPRTVYPSSSPTGVLANEEQLSEIVLRTSRFLEAKGLPKYKAPMELLAYKMQNNWAKGNRAKFDYDQEYIDALKNSLQGGASQIVNLGKSIPKAKDLYDLIFQALQP